MKGERYEEAEAVLKEAQKLWETVNSEENDEINYRLNLV